MPANLNKEFKDTVAQAGRVDKQIADRKIAMELTRKNYANDKARFMILKQPAEPYVAAPTSEVINTGEKSANKPTVAPTTGTNQVEKK